MKSERILRSLGTETRPARRTNAAAKPRMAALDSMSRRMPAGYGSVALTARSGERGGGRGEDSTPRFGPVIPGRAEPEFDDKPDCLKSFTVFVGDRLFKRIDAERVGFEAPFSVTADFKGPCPCSDLEYRQFIRGHIIRDPDGAKEDKGAVLNKLPGGQLFDGFQEDGDITTTPSQYGHRDVQASTNPKIVDQYTNAKGEVDQANGCHYEMSDTPFAALNSRPGEVWDIQLDFYGEIRKKGNPIQRRFWTPIKGRFTAP